ncbi:MAG: alpha/beta hydrolase [Gillisia sp.]
MILKFKGKNLFYSSKGSGNPIVLLHGFLESSTIWNSISEEISKKRQVICMDLPGHGKSATVAEVHTMELLAEAVHAVLTHLEVEKAVLVGHSMGGYVSLAFCEKFPIMTAGLVLINSTPKADNQEKKENRDRAIALVKKNKETYVSLAIASLLISEDKLKFDKELQQLKKEAVKFSKKGIIANLKGMKIRTDRTSCLKSFSGPKYVVAGRKDPVLNYTDIQYFSKECNCELHAYNGGHLAPIEISSSLTKIVHFIE